MAKVYILNIFNWPAVPGNKMNIVETEVIRVQHCSARGVSLLTSKPEGFAFQAGHYARLSLPTLAEPVWRAYSIVSAPHEPWLEYFFTVIPGGALSPHLGALQAGDTVLMAKAAMGFFLPDSLADGEVLWLLATGTGIGPYLSMLRQQGVLQRFARVNLVCSVREAADLAYDAECRAWAAQHAHCHYVPVVTRSETAGALHERIPTLLRSGALEQHLAMTPLDPQRDRVMVCGNPDFTADMRALLNERGFTPCRRGLNGNMLFENYWQKATP